MSKSLKTLLAATAALLFVASAVGLIFTLTTKAGGEEEGVEPSLDVQLIPREEIITAAYKSYGDNTQGLWAAKTIINNTGDVVVEGFTISYKIEGYCDWTSTENYPAIIPGQTVRDYCWPVLDGSRMKEIATKTPAELTVKYQYDGLDRPVEKTAKIFFLGRNDFVFTDLAEEDILTFADAYDNYPMIAAFVTPNEDTVKSVANAIASGLATNTSDEDALEAFLRCFYALRELGVRYIQEPMSYWSERTAQYVQYPAETLSRTSGTCLDLAICYAALMEAVGVRSYVVLIEGHAIPMIELPSSGELYAIEATFVDKDFALSHYPGETSAEVTAGECLTIAEDQLNAAAENGTYIPIDIRAMWQRGVMPIW